MTIHIPTFSIGNLFYCAHFRTGVSKTFVFQIGSMEVHLCAEHAEQLAEDVLEQLRAEQQNPPLPESDQ